MADVPTLVHEAEALTAQSIPVVLLGNGKVPLRNEGGGPPWGNVYAIDDPANAEIVIRAVSQHQRIGGIAMAIGRANHSPVIAVDIDGHDGLETAKQLGVRSDADVWIKSTPSGNWHVYYWCEDPSPVSKSIVGAGGSKLDLLCNNISPLPPAMAQGKDGVMRPYTWHRGPHDLPASALDAPPPLLMDWWQSLERPSSAGSVAKTHTYAEFLAGPLLQGQRNQELTRIAGKLRRAGMEPDEIEATLMSVNERHASPPLPESEVRTIARSSNTWPSGDVVRGANPAAFA